ncbi:DUF3313 family protein [Pseudomonas sp. NPDC086251]|uniref:DUF3313 family protein n=1 Tax=Pseudomonas sp. NPDC086251 TaxID=3364431 RepID=UPI00383507AA
MNLFRKVCAVMVMGSVLLSGCVSTVTPNTQFSEYFDSYRELKPAQSPSGLPVLRWVAPGFNPHRHSTVVFDYLDIYPPPKATDRIDARHGRTGPRPPCTGSADRRSGQPRLGDDELAQCFG